MDLSSIFRFSDMVEYFPKILSRFPVTLLIVVVSVAGGLVLGFILAAARIFKIPVLKELAALYISFVRGTPILVQLFVVYYGLPLLVAPLGVDINHWSKLFFVLVTYLLNDGAFMSEIIRSSIESVPKGQLEAAASVGLTTFQTYKRIIIPQAFKIAAPAFGTRVIGSFQATAMAFTLGIIDIMGQVKAIGTRTNRVLEGYVDAAIIFIIVSYLLERLFTWMEHRLNGQTRRKENGIALCVFVCFYSDRENMGSSAGYFAADFCSPVYRFPFWCSLCGDPPLQCSFCSFVFKK